jgi:TonB-linked SusC/RagA family outer membrane protein
MRIQALLLALLISHVHVVGQVVSFNYKNAPLETVLHDVSRQTGFSFLYQGQNLSDGRVNFSHAKPVTLILEGVEITDALRFVFETQSSYGYSLEKEIRRVFITNKEGTGTNTSTPFYNLRGRVSDEQGRPVEAVTITTKKGGQTTSTDSLGFFNIEGIRENDSLIITHVSYATKYEKVRVKRMMDIQVFPVTNNLDEVVISVVPTGYQKIPERKMTGSFSYIDSQQFNRRISTNFLDRIENMSTGVLFSRNQGSGSAVGGEFVVRGISTIFGSTKPLIVIDNFPYEGDPNNINPNDIESITILKDAVATGLWSAFAGNGVFVINTKKGKFDQAPRVSLVSNVTVGAKPDLHYLPVMSSEHYLEVTEFLYNSGYYNTSIATPYAPVPSNVMILDKVRKGLMTPAEGQQQLGQLATQDLQADLEKYIYRRSVNQQYALNINGGGNKMRYYFSGGFDKNFTNLSRNSYDRITLNASNTYLLLKDRLELTAAVAFAQSTTTENNSGIIPIPYPYTRLADENGNPAIVQSDYRQSYKDTAGGGRLMNWDYKPLEDLYLIDNQTKLTDYRVNLGAEYKLDYLLKGLKLTGRYQFSRGVSKQENYRPPESYFVRNLVNLYTQIGPGGSVSTPIEKGGIIDFHNYDYTSHSTRIQVDYNRVWKSIHNISIIGGLERRGMETQRDRFRYYGYDRSSQQRASPNYTTLYPLFPTPFQPLRIPNPTLSVGTIDNYLSYYTNVMYTLKYRYNFSFNLRKDESNLFGKRINQHGTPLWSVGAGWLMSSEKWFDISWLSELRIRATHGYTGNIDKTISPYTIIQYANVVNNFNQIQAFVQNPANRHLQWEKVRISNFAVDFSVRNYRFSGTLEFYLKDSKDLIGVSPLDQTTGASSFKGNIADMRGKGFDITLNARFVDKKKFKWYGTLLHSFVSNRVTSYPGSGRAIHLFVTQLQSNPLMGAPLESIYAYQWAGLDPADGSPRVFFNKQVSEQYDEVYNSTEVGNLVYVGTSTPRFFGSYRNTLSFKNLDFSFLIQYKLGYYFRRPSISYSTLFQRQDFGSPDYAIRWLESGDEITTNVPSLPYPADPLRDHVYLYSDALVEKADHIRLQDIQISYTLSKQRMKQLPFQSISFNIYINNIGIIWKATESRLDPDYLKDTYRAPMTGALGLQVNF